jgi:hypothetical protein
MGKTAKTPRPPRKEEQKNPWRSWRLGGSLLLPSLAFGAVVSFSGSSRAEWPAAQASLDGTVAPVQRPTVDSADSEEHSGVGPSIFFFNTEAGYETIDLHMLRSDNFIPVTVESSGGGAFFGLGAGVHLAFLTLGGRYRTGQWSNWNLSSLDGELGARITVGRFEPYFTFGAGYASMHTTEATSGGSASLDVHGFDGRAGLGVDYRADRVLSFGVNFTGDVLALARPGIDLTTSAQAQVEQIAARCNAIADVAGRQQCAIDAVQAAEGTSVGVGGAFSLVLGLHF